MKKIGIIGVYGFGENFTTGQAVKCTTLIEWLKKYYGNSQVIIVNTYQWKRHPISLLHQVIFMMVECKNIIIMPAQNGIKIFAPLVKKLNIILHRKLHYVVIGGWLPSMLKENIKLFKYIKKFNGVYVETVSMKEALEELDLNNVYHMPNCKDIKIIENDSIVINYKKPLQVCTFSRVVKEKGIIDAIDICQLANQKAGEFRFQLDIYGKITDEFKEELEERLRKSKDFACYKGVKDTKDSVKILSEYFSLLFPTYYEGEGFAGTILDAFASGTVILSNDWKYNSEIITNGYDGFIYPYRDIEEATNLLLKMSENMDQVFNMQRNCLSSAKKYLVETVMKEFTKYLE